MSDLSPQAIYDRGVDRLRETAKWIITIFAGLGAILGAGLQLSNIGRLDAGDWAADHRFLVAAIAGVVALLGIGVIINAAVKVFGSGSIDLTNLQSDQSTFAQRAGLFGEYTDGTAIRTRVEQIATERQTAEQAGNQTRVQALDQELDYLRRLIVQASSGIRYYAVEKVFRNSVKTIFLAGAVVAVAVIAFIWATNPPAAATDAPAFAVPVAGEAVLDQDARAALAADLGEDCLPTPLPVIVLSAGDGTADVVTIPSETCGLARFSVDLTDLRAVDPVDLPEATPEGS